MVYLQPMCRLIDDIAEFLESNGFEQIRQIRDGLDVLCTRTASKGSSRVILPLEITARTDEEAEQMADMADSCIRRISADEGYPLIITEDRWNRQKEMIQARILSHLEVFSQAYARNCEVRKIEKHEAQAFLDRYHSYGYAECRYRYGLFLRRHTGHIAEEMRKHNGDASPLMYGNGTLVAVATFSNARRWMKDGKEIRSYEWTRYASIPDMRVSGGMGKLLKSFIKEVKPDDIMSYADLEWSQGDVYRQLGFTLESFKSPVMFSVDRCSWERIPIRFMTADNRNSGFSGRFCFRNFGSNKYRLKLTEYE